MMMIFIENNYSQYKCGGDGIVNYYLIK